MQDYVKPVIVLFLICLISAGLLAYTFSLTDPVIQKNLKKAKDEALQEVLPEAQKFEKKKSKNLTYYVGKSGQGIAGYAMEAEAKGYQGPILLIIGMSKDGKITGLKVLQQAETPGLGAHITDDWFQKQFVGKLSTDKFSVKGENKDLDAITGATVSSNIVSTAVKDNSKKLIDQIGK